MTEPEWVHLELNIATLDRMALAERLDHARRLGLTLTTLAELGDDVASRRRLYELNRECSRDIPDRGEFYTWEEYQAERLGVPSFDPRGVVLALHESEWVGMMALSNQRDRVFVFVEMTGVIRSWRRRGVAAAMKAHGFDFATNCGVSVIRTFHHPDNIAAISANRNLGFVDA